MNNSTVIATSEHNIMLPVPQVLHIGHQREELVIELEGKKLNQRDSFVYLGGAVCGDGKTERERGTSTSTGWSERTESCSRCDGGPQRETSASMHARNDAQH